MLKKDKISYKNNLESTRMLKTVDKFKKMIINIIKKLNFIKNFYKKNEKLIGITDY